MGDDEGRADGANGQPEQQKGLEAVGEADQHDRKSAENHQARIGLSRSDPVAQGADEKPDEDGHRHRSDNGPTDIGFCKPQILPHHRHQRRDAEPAEEAQEKRHPRQMEGAHLNGLQAEQLY